MCGVEVWRGGLGGAYLLPALSSVGVPTENPIRFENTGFATIHAIIATHDELRPHCLFCCTCLKFSNQRLSAGRSTRPSPPIGGSSGQRAAPFAPQAFRSRAMGFVVALVSGLAPVSAN